MRKKLERQAGNIKKSKSRTRAATKRGKKVKKKKKEKSFGPPGPLGVSPPFLTGLSLKIADCEYRRSVFLGHAY